MNKENLHFRGTFGKLIQNITHATSKDNSSQTQQGSNHEIDINNQIEGQQIKVNDIIDIILYDPMLKELKQCLQKEAQTKKKAQLLQTFPNRYRNLLNTQSLFKKLQIQIKQHQSQTKAILSLMQKQKQDFIDQISYLKAQIQCKQNQKMFKVQQMMIEQHQKDRLHHEQIKDMKATIQQINNKLLKSKLQKDHLLQYTEQIKQDLCELQTENDRLVDILKNYQLQIKEFKEKYVLNEQTLRKEIDDLISNQDQYKQIIQEKNSQINTKDQQFKAAQLTLKIQRLKIEEYQSQIQRMKDEFEIENVNKFEQIQQVRKRLLEQIKLKHQLQELLEQRSMNFDQNYEQRQKIIEELSNVKTKLQIQLENAMRQKQMQIINLSNQFKQEKTQFQAKINSILSQLQQKTIQIQILTAQLHHDKQTVQIYKNKCLSYQKQISDTTTIPLHIHKQESQILKSIFKDQISKYQSLLKEKDQKINQLRQDIKSLRQKMKDHAINLNSVKSKQMANDAIMTLLKQKLAKSQFKVQQAIKQSTRHKQQLKRYEQKCHRYRQQAQHLKSMLDEKEKKVIEVRKGMKDGWAQVDIVVEDPLTQELKKLASRYQNLLEQTKIYKNQYKLQNQTHTIQQENALLKAENNKLKADIEDLRQSLTSHIDQQKMHFQSLLFSEQSKIVEKEILSKTFIKEIKQELIELSSQLIQKEQIERQLLDKLSSIAVSK